MGFSEAEKYISELFRLKLSSAIYYHDFAHTQDVINAAEEIAFAEKISDADELMILKTAALFHDCGFVNVYNEHEEEGCRIARKHLPVFDYTQDEIDRICELIMATKIPQKPSTFLARILCDADLDYLGRDDYSTKAQKLFDEWKLRGKIHSEKEWNELQIKFLESHHYWTKSAYSRRELKKHEHLENLKKMVYD
jgi:uncharacterized protein